MYLIKVNRAGAFGRFKKGYTFLASFLLLLFTMQFLLENACIYNNSQIENIAIESDFEDECKDTEAKEEIKEYKECLSLLSLGAYASFHLPQSFPIPVDHTLYLELTAAIFSPPPEIS
jgi:hypothetical protein